MILSSYGAACMQYSSDFTKVMREAGYIYPFDWRRRRMDRNYEEPQGIIIFLARKLIKNVQRRKNEI